MLNWNQEIAYFKNLEDYNKAYNINENLLNAKMGDFGFSKQIKPNENEIDYYGTPIYMAPEILKG